MASSWFKGLSSILSRKSKRKLVIEKPLSRFSRYLALERLEDRLNLNNTIQFSGGVLLATISDNGRDILTSYNSGSNAITFTDQTIGGSTQWVAVGANPPGAVFNNNNVGQAPTSVTITLSTGNGYNAGTLTSINIAANGTQNSYSFGLLNTLASATINGGGTGFYANQLVNIGTPALGRELATARVDSVSAPAGSINTITLLNSGSGYDPFGTIIQPVVPLATDVNATIGAVALTGTGVTLGTASITISNGAVAILGAPIVQFNPTNGGSGAAGTANIVNGQIASINVTNAGTGYLSAPTVTILTGTGATAITALNTSGALDFSTLSATNVGFWFKCTKCWHSEFY